MITDCDRDTSVPDWVVEHPESLPVFRELGIDYCCGGKSLEYACRERGLAVESVIEKLHRAIAGGGSRAVLSSIQVGLPRNLGEEGAADAMDRPWTTGFFKEPVPGPVWLGATNLEGDRQADTVHHGGPDKAVLAYSAEHYPMWRETLNQPVLPFGAFGENFTIQGLTEVDVCIGDTWRVGEDVRVQVSQPRQPCWKLARRWRIKSLPAQVQQTGRTGWYFRVLVEGCVAQGMPMSLLERPYPEWTIERANQVMHSIQDDLRVVAELAEIPRLSASWRKTLAGRLEHNRRPDTAARLDGENR